MSASHPDPRRWKALALLCTAFFMVILYSAIVVVAHVDDADHGISPPPTWAERLSAIRFPPVIRRRGPDRARRFLHAVPSLFLHAILPSLLSRGAGRHRVLVSSFKLNKRNKAPGFSAGIAASCSTAAA